MKRFLTNFGLFMLLAVVCIGLALMLVVSTRNRAMQLPQGVTNVYLGNSTIECSINDSIISNSYNFGRSSEEIEFIYAKIKSLFRANERIDTIFIGLDDIILFKSFNHPFNHPYANTEFDLDDWATIIRNSTFEKWTAFISHPFNLVDIRLTTAAAKNGNIKQLNMGNYLYLKRDKLSADLERQKTDPYTKHDISELNAGNLHFFKKIARICQEHGTQLVFLSTPKYKNLWDHVAYRDFHRIYMPDIPLYDHLTIEFPDSCYGDCLHLNHRGARLYSRMLAGAPQE